MKKRLFQTLVAAAIIAAGYGVSDAYQQYLTAFNTLYGTSSTALNSCVLCHIDPGGGGTRNAYGNAFRAVSTHTTNPSGAFTTIQNADSDADGYTNIAEINVRTFPGDATSHPGTVTACTSFTYNAWGACQSNGTQTRTVATSSPSGCTGGSPVTSQACTYTQACTSYSYTWGACQPNSTQTATSTTGIPSGCSGGAVPATTQSCTYTATACTSYTYTLGVCQSNNTAPVLNYAGIPSGCSGGLSPATTRPCTYTPPVSGNVMLISPATSGLVWDDTYKNLGVGTSSPQYDFDLSSQGAMRSSLHFSKDGNDVGGWITSVLDTNFFLSAGAMYDASAGGWVQKSPSGVAVIMGGDIPGFSVYTSSGTPVGSIAPVSPKMVITPTGNVGIGTTTPVYPLQMGSGAYVTPGGVWTNASSREYKDNIKDLSTEEAVETLKELNPVKYNYKTDSSDKHVGFIAEDVPELVATKDRKGLSPMDIVAVVTKVMQEQQKTIEAQQKTIDALSEKVSDLQREVRLKGSVASAGRMAPLDQGPEQEYTKSKQ